MFKNITYFSLLIYIILAPILPSKFKVGKLPVNIDTLILLVVLCYFISIIVSKRTRKNLLFAIKDFFRDPLNIFIFIWIAMMFISVTYATDKSLAIKESIRFSTYAVLFFIIKYEITREKMAEGIMKIYIFICGIISVIGLYDFIKVFSKFSHENFNAENRITATLENSNNLGAFFVLAIFPIFMIMIGEKNKKLKTYYGVIFALCLINIVGSASRNALLSTVVGFIVLALIYNIKLIWVPIAGTGVGLLFPAVRERMLQIMDFSQNSSRIKLWGVAMAIIKDYPVKGVGMGNYRTKYPLYKSKFSNIEYYVGKNYHPHNVYLKMQCELGIVGLISFLGIMILSFIRSLNLRNTISSDYGKRFYYGFCASIAAFMAMNFIDNFFSAPKVVCIFWIFVALGESYRVRTKKGCN